MKNRVSVLVIFMFLLAGANLALAQTSKGGVGVYDIREFGAVGDGKTLNTKALQAAIDAASADRGGTVLVPAGVFVIGTTEIKSSVTLHLAASARLLGTHDPAQYHPAPGVTNNDSTMGDSMTGLIYGVGVTNVTVEGPGTIDGGGAPPREISGSRRPYALFFHQSKNITVRDIEMVRCPFHMIRASQSAFLKFDNIHIYNRLVANNDGFHFVSCEYVHVSNCDVQCQDDACALFGSCKNITVTNCTFGTRWSVFRFGGGICENVTVSNCVMNGVYGCPIKFQGGPGNCFRNMLFSNIIMQDVTGPITISISSPPDVPHGVEPAMYSLPPQPVEGGRQRIEGGCVVRNIAFDNIRGTVATTQTVTGYFMGRHYGEGETYSAIVLSATGSAVMEDISLSNINLTFAGGGTAAMGANRNVPQRSGEYFALGAIPAYALYARNVKGLSLSNVRFNYDKSEQRPAVIFDGVQDAAISGLSVAGNEKAESAMRFMNSKDVLLTSPRLTVPAPVFLNVEGEGSKNIKVEGGDYSKAEKPFTFAAGATDRALKARE